MIVVVESLLTGQVHVPGNVSLLATLALAFPGRPIRFAAEREHLRYVRETPDTPPGIEYVEIDVLPERAHPVARLFSEIAILRRILADVPRTQPHLLVQASTNGCALRTGVYAARLRPGMRAWVRLHGNLNEIDGWRPRNPVWRYLSMRAGLEALRGGRLRPVLLERPIVDALVAKIPSLAGQCDVLPEYVLPAERKRFAPRGLARPPRFSYLGLGTLAKGLDLFLATAARCKEAGLPARFTMFGEMHPSLKHLDVSGLDPPPTGERLSREQYLVGLAETDYVVVPYQPEYYLLSASGVMIDAITALKPVIALPVPFAAALFEAHGDIGYLCRDGAELGDTVLRIAQAPDPQRYQAQVEAMRRLQDARSIEAVAVMARGIFTR